MTWQFPGTRNKHDPKYVTALNNLAHAYSGRFNGSGATVYEQVLVCSKTLLPSAVLNHTETAWGLKG